MLASREHSGLTHVLDKGLGPRGWEDVLETAGDYISIVKLGWGTAYVTRNLERKLAVLREKPVVIGGTFFEAVYATGDLDEYKRWLQSLGLTHVEISDGTVDIPRERKLELIADFARDFTVLSEVGSKDSSVEYTADEWITWLNEDLAAGAWKVITEAREGGTAGIFDSSGGMRTELIGEIALAVGPTNVIFEAPSKAAQSWFVKSFGPSVNLGNIPPEEVIPLETLRLGLRGDTLKEVLLDVRSGAGRAAASAHGAAPSSLRRVATTLQLPPDVETWTAERVVAFALEQFPGRVALASSFQKEETVLLDMLFAADPKARVFAIDTHHLFPETYELWKAIESRYATTIETFAGEPVEDGVWERNPDLYLAIAKVEPLNRALLDLDCWITGIRRDQSPTRADSPKLGWDDQHELWKANPLADWTDDDCWRYIRERGLPYNPLHDRGYDSIGDTHSTLPGKGRAGRWAGTERTECGLHT